MKTEDRQKYLITHTPDGKVEAVYIVHFWRNGVVGVEALDYVYVISLLASGSGPSTETEDIVPERFFEYEISDLVEPRFYYTWMGVVGELARDKTFE